MIPCRIWNIAAYYTQSYRNTHTHAILLLRNRRCCARAGNCYDRRSPKKQPPAFAIANHRRLVRDFLPPPFNGQSRTFTTREPPPPKTMSMCKRGILRAASSRPHVERERERKKEREDKEICAVVFVYPREPENSGFSLSFVITRPPVRSREARPWCAPIFLHSMVLPQPQPPFA